MDLRLDSALPIAVLDAVPNPVLVKDAETRYVWVNAAFERLFSMRREDVIGELDTEIFQHRQAVQCNGGDLRVLASGEVDEAVETMIDPELGERRTITRKSRLTVGTTHYLVGVMHDVTDVFEVNKVLERQAVELERLASTDPLTDCLNRRAIRAQATDLVNADSIGVIALDLDRFKDINDTHGHDVGDAVLIHFVDTVRKQLRLGDIVGRTGGEEFVVLLPTANATEVVKIAERIRLAVRETPATHAASTIPYTVSIGAVHKGRDEAVSIDELLRTADQRLYEAKDRGRDMVVTA